MPPAAARHGHALDLRTAFALARDEVHAHSAPPLPSLAVRRKRGEAQLLPEPLTQIVLPPPPVPVAPPAAPQPPPPEPVIAWGALLPEGVGVVRPPPPQPVQPPPSPPPGTWSSPGLNVLTASNAKCSTIESSADFCGVGMVYNSASAHSECATATCSKDKPGDVAACCTSSAPYTLYASSRRDDGGDGGGGGGGGDGGGG